MKARSLTSLAAFVGFLLATTAMPVLADNPKSGASADASSDLQEVVVTARRREEKLQSVPISVSAFSQQSLEQNHIESVADLQYHVPSMTLFGPQSDLLFLSIRGQGGYEPGAAASVVSYLNEVPIPTSPHEGGALGGTGLYYDLESLQVLKGPQGTLFGRNTTGGALLLQSKMPSNEFGGHIQFTLGDYDDREIDAAVNVPIVDEKLLARIAVNGATRDGYTAAQSTPTRPGGIDLDNKQYFAGRASIRFRPADGVLNDLIIDGLNNRNNGNSTVLSYVSPTSFVNSFFPGLAGVLARQQSQGIRTQVPLSQTPFSHESRFSANDILSIDLSDELTFKNILGYTRATIAYATDVDGTIFPIYETEQTRPSVVHQYSEEAQLQGKSFAEKLTWTAGAFFLRSPAPNFDLTVESVFATPVILQTRAGEESKALYLQGTYDLSEFIEGLKFTGGVRYSWDDRFAQSRTFAASVCGSPPSEVDAQCTLTGKANFSAPTWTVGLDYQASPDTLLYITSRRGYRTGGFNLGVASAQDQKFLPEYVTDVELGAKSDWSLLGAKVRTNAAIFHEDYTAIQLDQIVQDPILGATEVTKNPADASIWGAEFEGAIRPVHDLELQAQFSWLSFEYTHLAHGLTPAILDATIRSPNRPRYKYALGATYHAPVDPALGQISLSVNWAWQDTAYIVAVPDPLDLQPAYGLLTIGADWNNINGAPVDLSFFMTNATDQVYAGGGYQISNFVGTSTLSYGAPRMFGFRLKYRFGAEAGSSAAETVSNYIPPAAVTPAPARLPNSYLVFFDFNKSDLTPQAVQIVAAAAKNSALAKATRITATGHTDTVGSDAYNMRLSRRRAESVAAELEKDGIPSSEIEIIAKGKRDLLVPTQDGVREPQNRRVQIVYDSGLNS